MIQKKDLSIPRNGMNREAHESELQKSEYSFALNANIQDEHGNGAVMLQNEPSNLLCSTFKAGFKVVGFKYDVNSDNTYFFITNPTTHVSEIGYIANTEPANSLEAIENSCNCDPSVVLEQPLEHTTQTALCNYITLVSDAPVGGCAGHNLNFNINYPIFSNNIQIKNERLGKTIYWTDGYNPPRYINLDENGVTAHPKYTQYFDCHTGTYTTAICLDVDAMRIFPLYQKPCSVVTNTIAGANLKAGLYQVFIAYCNGSGDELSQYFMAAMPVSIFDKNNNVLDRSNLDYVTNQGFVVNVSHLDTNYEYFKVVVSYTSGLHGETSFYFTEIYGTDLETVAITQLPTTGPNTNLTNILLPKPHILTTSGMTNSNGYLLQNGVKERREINLQPVVNLMGAFAQWTTQQAKENLYERGESTAKYKGYMRDEVYPFGIKFIMTGGYETAVFPLVPRPATESEMAVVTGGDDLNVNSVIAYNPACSPNERQYRWQFENTADVSTFVDLDCSIAGVTTVSENKNDTASCQIIVKHGVTDNGDWNATTNTPSLTVGAGTEGDYYKVLVAGTQTFGAGPISFAIGDYVVRHSGDWVKSIADVTAEVAGPLELVYTSDNDLLTYINDNIDYFRSYVSDPTLSDNSTRLAIQSAIVEAETHYTDCIPSFNGKPTSPPSTPTLSTKIASALSVNVDSIVQTEVSPDSLNYIHVKAPTTCSNLSTDPTTGKPTIDTTLTNMINPAGFVYKRNPVANLTPDSAKSLTFLTDPQVDQPRYLPQYVDTDPSNLITTIPAEVSPPTGYQSFIHKNAIWFSVDTSVTASTNVELSKMWCNVSDSNTQNSIRVSFYNDTTLAPIVTKHIPDTSVYSSSNNFYTLLSTDYPSGTAYIAIDSPIVETGAKKYTFYLSGSSGDVATISFAGTSFSYDFTIDPTAPIFSHTIDNIIGTYGPSMLSDAGVVVVKEGSDTISFYSNYVVSIDHANTPGPITSFYSTKVPCGCFNIFKQKPLYEQHVTFDSLNLSTMFTYIEMRTFVHPVLGNCDVAPHKKGNFAYWQSTEIYPCNAELYDSSLLQIDYTDLSQFSSDERTLFDNYFNKGVSHTSGPYSFDPTDTNINLTSQPIKHYKFPDNKTIPFMNTKDNAPGDFKNSIIYPIGFHLDTKFINTFLDIAVKNNLMTLEERSLITQYEIFRGDRRISQSVIAKGLLFDMLSENTTGILYSNYPLNALGSDNRNGNDDSSWFNSKGNINYSFYSPNTLFNNPTLPRELSIEGTMYGKTKMYYDTVDRHPTYTVLSQGSYTLATTLAIAEVTLEALAKAGDWLTLGFTGDYVTASFGEAIALVQVGLYAAGQVFEVGVKRLQWIDTLYNLGHPINHAYYQVAIGHYNIFNPTPLSSDSKLRGLAISHYLRDGLWNVADEYTHATLKINNRQRENQVFLSMSDSAYQLNYTSDYYNWDNTNTNTKLSSRVGYLGTGKSPEINTNAASMYATLKQYNPAQYGIIGSVQWYNTGYCGDLNSGPTCDTIFGGDIFISRFAVKRKFPFFTTTAFGLPPQTPFIYSYYFNINPQSDITTGSRLFLNYKMIDEQTDDVGIGSLFFPSQRSQYRFEGEQSHTGSHLYVNPEAKFYLYSYGFPYYLVESEYNCNYRYAGINRDEDFYPNTGDIISFTQERYVPISSQESFNYNPVYSNTQITTGWRTLPDIYKRSDYDRIASMPNSVIVSRQDNSEGSSVYIDPWLVYSYTNENGITVYNQNNFPTNFGKLESLKAIEASIILARFTNTITAFQTDNTDSNIYDQLAAAQTKSFNKTDLGYGGTQHQAMLSTQYGHIWVDAQRGKVFMMAAQGGGLQEISFGLEKWFKENLPFNLIKQFDINVDNSYNGIGICMGWDDRLKRAFITKKDFKLKSNLGVTVLYTLDLGFHYVYSGSPVSITLGDPAFFEDCSWTLAYSPITNSWISYYSYKPNYYISQNDYFQTGINYSMDSTELGLWSHFSFLSSYQVFYGKLYPFTIDYAVPLKYSNSVYEAVEYMLDVRKYYDKYDYSDVYGVGFNKAVVYNNQQNSGLLELVHQKENDMSQSINYPQFNANSISILQSCINNKWSFNYLYNLVKNAKSGLPLWLYDSAKVNKTLNDPLLDYRSNYKDRLRGNYFKVQLTNDLESRYKFILQYALDDRNFYEQ